MEIIQGMGLFLGLVISWVVGWYAFDGVKWLFSLRFRTTPTHFVIETKRPPNHYWDDVNNNTYCCCEECDAYREEIIDLPSVEDLEAQRLRMMPRWMSAELDERAYDLAKSMREEYEADHHHLVRNRVSDEDFEAHLETMNHPDKQYADNIKYLNLKENIYSSAFLDAAAKMEPSLLQEALDELKDYNGENGDGFYVYR